MNLSYFLVAFDILSNNRIVDFTSKAINLIFHNRKHLICLGDANALVVQTMIYSNSSVMYLRYNYNSTYASGYVIYFEDFKALQKMFQENYRFLPHTSILIFTDSKDIGDPSVFNAAYNLRANDLFVITGLSLESDVNLRHLKTGTLLGNCGKYSCKFYVYNFRSPPWMPHFDNTTFNICAFYCAPWLLIDEKGVSHGGAESLALNYITRSWPIQWILFPKSSWWEVLAYLKNKTCDLGLCGVQLLDVAEEDISCTSVYLSAVGTLLIPKPTLLPEDSFVFQPFRTGVWIAIFATGLLVAGIIKLCSEKEYIGLVLDVFGTIFQNSRDYWSNHGMFALMNVLSLFLVTYYAAGYATNLAAPRHTGAIETFQDVLESTLTYSSNWLPKSLAQSTSPNARLLAQSTRHYDPKKEDSFYIVRSIVGFQLILDKSVPKSRKKQLKVLSEPVKTYTYVLGLQKYSPYREMFSESVMRFMEQGLWHAWLRMTIFNSISDLEDTIDFTSYYAAKVVRHKPINMKKVLGILYALFFGYAISVLSFAIEIVLHRYT